MYDILSGTVRMNHVMGEAFIEIPPTLIEEWERIQKRSFDIVASLAALVLTSPIILYTIFRIKYDSNGCRILFSRTTWTIWKAIFDI
jgi:lipopolysaccharide/colanic/teichoic acid biosynthesis glycosyltransferase